MAQMPMNPATTSNDVVVNGWSFIAFVESHCLPVYQERTNMASGEKFKSLRFPKQKVNQETGEIEDLYVNFSSKRWPDSAELPDNFADFLAEYPAKDLRVVELNTGGYSLCMSNFENNDQQVTAEMLGL